MTEEFGEFIRAKRLALGKLEGEPVSQETFAGRAGASLSMVNRVEGGSRNLSDEKAREWRPALRTMSREEEAYYYLLAAGTRKEIAQAELYFGGPLMINADTSAAAALILFSLANEEATKALEARFSLAALVKYYRERMGFSQHGITPLLDYAKSALLRIENGERTIGIRHVNSAILGLHVPLQNRAAFRFLATGHSPEFTADILSASRPIEPVELFLGQPAYLS